jgi:hypothetical protein
MRRLIICLVLFCVTVIGVFGQSRTSWTIEDAPHWVINAIDNKQTESFIVTKIKYIPVQVMTLFSSAIARYTDQDIYYVWRLNESNIAEMYVYDRVKQAYWRMFVYAY